MITTRIAGTGSHGERGEDGLVMMRRVAITMFLVGGVTCLSGVWTIQATPVSKLAQAVVSAGLVVTGLGVWAVPTPRRRLLEVGVAWSIVVLSTLVALSEPIGMAPLFYLWPMVFAAYFSSNTVVVVIYVWMGAALAVALALNETHTLKIDTFVGTMACVGLVAALVAAMTHQEAHLRRELAVAAETDPLTGLLNRRSFNPQLAVLAADAVARRRPLSIVMFDLDHFKRLNDERGHLTGDRALQEVAVILRSQSRDEDLVSRFGGEEFAVALPSADADDGRRYAERVAVALHGLVASADLRLSISAGITSMHGADDTVESMLRRADDALYAAKAAGRCRYASWEDGISVGPRFGAPTVA